MNMIKIQYMKPFFSKVHERKLRLIFAYQYFSIIKEDEAYHFIPVEGKEIVVNLDKMQVENLSEIFVFQRGSKFIRLPLYQLLLVSNIYDHLTPIIEREAKGESVGIVPRKEPGCENEVTDETLKVVGEIELNNLRKLIDESLDAGNEELFLKLSSMLPEFS